MNSTAAMYDHSSNDIVSSAGGAGARLAIRRRERDTLLHTIMSFVLSYNHNIAMIDVDANFCEPKQKIESANH